MDYVLESFQNEDVHHCPICYKKHDDKYTNEQIIKHVKRCYYVRSIKHGVAACGKNANRHRKIQAMSDTIESVDEEINNYWLSFLFDE